MSEPTSKQLQEQERIKRIVADALAQVDTSLPPEEALLKKLRDAVEMVVADMKPRYGIYDGKMHRQPELMHEAVKRVSDIIGTFSNDEKHWLLSCVAGSQVALRVRKENMLI